MRKITIWEQSTGTRLLAGEMVSHIDASGRARCQFRYRPEFLEREGAYPLDPVSLPLRSGTFEADRKAIFDVFEDSLPDDWGRALLIRRHHLARGEQDLANLLLALGSEGLGALIYGGDQLDKAPGDPAKESEASVPDLELLLEAAARYERGEEVDRELALLFTAGSSPGGARPKVLVYDPREKAHYLAKFPSVRDHVDVVRIEQATMSLAAKAGLATAPTRVVECAGHPVLLVHRFDLMPERRRHMVSFRTLLKAGSYYFCRYGELHDVVRKFSVDPSRDAELLFRQMVFNALMGNTDDHLKNFWMVYGQLEGWRLSPAFDLVPNIARRQEHVLRFDLDPVNPGRRNLERLGRSWGVSGSRAIVEEICTNVAGWRTQFAEAGVRAGDIDRFREIDWNLAKA